MLQSNLLMLRNRAGASASDVLFFNVGNAGIGTLSETIETLMACVDSLSTRVHILEHNEQATAAD